MTPVPALLIGFWRANASLNDFYFERYTLLILLLSCLAVLPLVGALSV